MLKMVPNCVLTSRERLNVPHWEGARLGALGVGGKTVYVSGSLSAAALLETILSILRYSIISVLKIAANCVLGSPQSPLTRMRIGPACSRLGRRLPCRVAELTPA
jgi:hypothetical protein